MNKSIENLCEPARLQGAAPSDRQAATSGVSLWHWWPLLLGPASMLLVYWAHFSEHPAVYQKRLHETLAIVLLALAGIGFASCALVWRRPIHIILAVLTAALFCREWHFAGTSTGIYIALAVIGVWGYLWRAKLICAMRGQLKVWTVATFATYFLSVLISRRVFRSVCLPLEGELHVAFEEVMETAAHSMLLVTSLVAWKSPQPGANSSSDALPTEEPS